MITFTKEQLSEVMCKHAEKENGLHDLLEIMLESLMVANGITGLDVVIGEKFPGTAFQRCTTHLKRDMLASVRHGDKKALADDLRDVFRTGDKNYTIDDGIAAWKDMYRKWGKGSPRSRLLPCWT